MKPAITPTATASSCPHIIGLTKEALLATLKQRNIPAFRAKQLWHWIYHRGIYDVQKMHNIGKDLQQTINTSFRISRPTISTEQKSSDGTIKWLLKFADGHEVETVFIPEEDRGTLCISSQVGCTLTCSFCHTGTQRLVRNLTAEEIVSQVMVARDRLNGWPSSTRPRLLSNIVLMGMGEPLLNYDHVRDAINIITDGDGIALSRRRITLSTSGIVPKIESIGHDTGVNLAISLHATTDDVRNELVPINKKYPISELLEACKRYPAKDLNRRITFEYVMLDGVNDSSDDAKRLVRLIKDIPSKVNLIPFNPWPGSNYKCSSMKQIEKFSSIIKSHDIQAPIRTPRGQDILAACGQLKSASQKQKRSISNR